LEGKGCVAIVPNSSSTTSGCLPQCVGRHLTASHAISVDRSPHQLEDGDGNVAMLVLSILLPRARLCSRVFAVGEWRVFSAWVFRHSYPQAELETPNYLRRRGSCLATVLHLPNRGKGPKPLRRVALPGFTEVQDEELTMFGNSGSGCIFGAKIPCAVSGESGAARLWR